MSQTLSTETRNWWAKAVVHPDFHAGLNWLRANARPGGTTATPHEANILLGRVLEFEETLRKLVKLGDIPRPPRQEEERPVLYDTRNLGLDED